MTTFFLAALLVLVSSSYAAPLPAPKIKVDPVKQGIEDKLDFSKGKFAFIRNQPLSSNPFLQPGKRDERKAALWEKGWLEMKSHRENPPKD